jgi:hypothetical protein
MAAYLLPPTLVCCECCPQRAGPPGPVSPPAPVTPAMPCHTPAKRRHHRRPVAMLHHCCCCSCHLLLPWLCDCGSEAAATAAPRAQQPPPPLSLLTPCRCITSAAQRLLHHPSRRSCGHSQASAWRHTPRAGGSYPCGPAGGPAAQPPCPRVGGRPGAAGDARPCCCVSGGGGPWNRAAPGGAPDVPAPAVAVAGRGPPGGSC